MNPTMKSDIRLLSDHTFRDGFRVPEEVVKAYPEMHFCWKHRGDDSVMKAEGSGYIVVQRPQSETTGKKKSYKSSISGSALDSVYTHGDSILMMCPKAQFEQFDEALNARRRLASGDYGNTKDKINAEMRRAGLDARAESVTSTES